MPRRTGLLIINNFRFARSDQINPVTTKSVVLFSRCTCASEDNLQFVEKTKISEISNVEFDGSVDSIHKCYFHNQKAFIYSKNGSQIRVDDDNAHSMTPSTYFMFAQAAIIHYLGKVEFPAGTKHKEYKAGRILT